MFRLEMEKMRETWWKSAETSAIREKSIKVSRLGHSTRTKALGWVRDFLGIIMLFVCILRGNRNGVRGRL